MTTPYYADDSVTLYHGDCLDILPELPDNSVDAVVTDPPYGLEFMGREWDGADGFRRSLNKADVGRESAFGRLSRVGPEYRAVVLFQEWCQAWAVECLRILKPGGHLLAFGGTRTSHRLVSGIEDGGFEIRDSKVWLYGSGFPKSLNVGRAIDGMFCREAGTHSDDPEHVCPLTPQGDEWRGHGTALKPAHEPIVVARKPLSGTVAANVLQWGTGALNIEGARIGTDTIVSVPGAVGSLNKRRHEHGTRPSEYVDKRTEPSSHVGRWPANVVLDESQAAALDQMSGESVSAGGSRGAGGQYGTYSPIGAQPDFEPSYGDSGGASRFYLTAKASSDERITHNGTSHPTVKPLSLMRWLVRLVTPPGGLILEPFAGSGTTVEAALLEGFRCIAVEREAEYLPLITQRIHRRRDPIAYIKAAGEDLGLFGDDNDEPDAPSQPQGRWPANVVLDRSQAEALDQMSGERRSAGDYPSDAESSGIFGDRQQGQLYGDSGGASRFFKVVDDDGDGVA